MRQGQLRRVKREVKSVNIGGYAYSISEMFEQFMLIKNEEGLAKRTFKKYYNNFQYFMECIGQEFSAKEMTTEVFTGGISYTCDELDYSPATVNIRVRTMRSFLRYIYEDKQWIQEPIHKRFKPIKALIDNVEAFTPEEYKRLIITSNYNQSRFICESEFSLIISGWTNALLNLSKSSFVEIIPPPACLKLRLL